MDDLVTNALDEVALQGSHGCTLAELWKCMANPDDDVKEFLWKKLLASPHTTFRKPPKVYYSTGDVLAHVLEANSIILTNNTPHRNQAKARAQGT